MALVTCPDCGSEVSDAAPACPKCGRPASKPLVAQVPVTHGKRNGCLMLFVATVVLIGIGQIARPSSSAAPGVPTAQAPVDSTPGITRVGLKRAAGDWAGLRTMPGLAKWTCQERTCVVMYDPAIWGEAPFDLKRDITAGVGIALAFGQHASYVELHDNLTNAELSEYLVRSDHVAIK